MKKPKNSSPTTVNTLTMKGCVTMPLLQQNKEYTIDDIYALPDGQRAELIDGLLLFTKPHTYKGAAVTHTITGQPGFFWGGKLLFILFANTTGDLAVRKVEYFLIAFCAVKYHEGVNSFLCMT